MSQNYIPLQKQFNTPVTQRILHQNTQDSKVYLSRSSNNILNAIGNDLVLKGLTISDIQVLNNLSIQFTIDPGLIIQDSTLISIESQTVLDINVRPFDNNGYLIIYTEYQYLNTLQENNLKLKLSYITANGEHLSSDTEVWNPNTNRLLLYRFSFRKSPILITTQVTETSFNIFNKTYTNFGIDNFTNFSVQTKDHASNGPMYGYATRDLAGHVRVGDNIDIINGTISVPPASQTSNGVVKFSDDSETLLLEADNLAVTPKGLRNLILNLKNIEIQVTDPGITLGTAMILS